jgi:hypothetical protein
MKKILCACLALPIAVGCGGGSGTVSARHTGIYEGAYTDGQGRLVTIETEQVHRGTALTGVARIEVGGETYHVTFHGDARGDTYSWSGELPGGKGRIAVRSDLAGSAHFTAQGDLSSGSGNLVRTADATTDNLAGTYTVTWNAQGFSDNFTIEITNVNGVDVVPNLYVKLPDNGGFVASGTVVGNTVALTYFSGAGTNGFLAKFKPTAIGQTGSASFELIATGGSTFDGTWTITPGGQ